MDEEQKDDDNEYEEEVIFRQSYFWNLTEFHVFWVTFLQGKPMSLVIGSNET